MRARTRDWLVDMKIVVLGASGFLGSHLVDVLLAGGEDVVLGDCSPSRWLDNAGLRQVDVTDRAAVEHLLAAAAPDVVVHLAGLLGTTETFNYPARTCEVNLVGTVHILETIRSLPDTRYVGVETGTNWLNPYAISKRAATQMAVGYHEAFGLPVTVLKIHNAYGPRQEGLREVNKVVPRFIACALEGLPLPIFGDGKQVMDLVPVAFCVRALTAAVKSGQGIGMVIPVGTGRRTSVNDLAAHVLELAGGGTITHLPRRIGEGPIHTVADTTLATRVLGLSPPDPMEQLAETFDWYGEQYNSLP
jgi:UDP-glucose 4-epimerase